MKRIEIDKLLSAEYFVRDIVCDFQVWNDSQVWYTPSTGRINTGFMLVLSKNAVYKLQNGNTIYISPGDMVILPKGSCYSCTFYDSEDDKIDLVFRGVQRSCLFLGFEMFDDKFENMTFDGEPSVLFNARSSDIIRKFDYLCKYSKQPDCSFGMLCAETLSFLSQLSSKHLEFSNKDSNPLDSIVSYIYENIQTVTASDIISLSGLSPSTFRRRFFERFGVSPVTYINNAKTENAKAYFQSGMTRIKVVSRLCGIEDEFYFSRLFTKTVGISPTSYIKKIKNLNK